MNARELYAKRLYLIRILNKDAGQPFFSHLVEPQNSERITMAARYNCFHLLFRESVFRKLGQVPLLAPPTRLFQVADETGTFHISRA